MIVFGAPEVVLVMVQLRAGKVIRQPSVPSLTVMPPPGVPAPGATTPMATATE
ncbi:MAG: hypothetical protein IPI73_08565 [Betaproteobacteria bacterium]|nr:hypothetical protein [Betaproteobacteria bacterium]